MKIRLGFISNSSSSSFVAIVSPEAFESALSALKNDIGRKVMRYITNKKNVLGKPMMVAQEQMGTGGVSTLFGDGGDLDYDAAGLTEKEMDECSDDYKSPSEWFSEYQDILEKLQKGEFKDQIFILREDS